MNFEKIKNDLKEMNSRDIFYLKEKIFLLSIFFMFYVGTVLIIIHNLLYKYNLISKLIYSKSSFFYNLLLVLIIFCIGCSLSYITAVLVVNFWKKHKAFEKFASVILKTDNIISPTLFIIFTRIFLIFFFFFLFIKFIKIIFLTNFVIPYYNYIVLTIAISLPLILLGSIISFMGDLILLMKEKMKK